MSCSSTAGLCTRWGRCCAVQWGCRCLWAFPAFWSQIQLVRFSCRLRRVGTRPGLSTNEVNDHEMEHRVGEQEVGEGSLRGDGQEVTFVLRVYLDPQAHSKDKGSDTRYKAGEKAVEGEGADKQAVKELQRPG
uniref:Uncharacterized protein n=1 Tax=Anguilla anguilla TaxID=7936 RepID=A0A0E9WS41_ANGAN